MVSLGNVCNVCGRKFNQLDEQENFGFDYHVGYGSKYDLTHLQAHICIDCFDKLMDQFIPACKISPDKGEYQIRGDADFCGDELMAEDFDNT